MKKNKCSKKDDNGAEHDFMTKKNWEELEGTLSWPEDDGFLNGHIELIPLDNE